jgi:L-alanine-DL-glutamate epimerase-like enolase superfamily enzyme
MKITGVETFPVWGGKRNYLFVVVDTDEGLYGVGEAGLTGRELAVSGAVEHFEPLLWARTLFARSTSGNCSFGEASLPPGTQFRRRSRPWT